MSGDRWIVVRNWDRFQHPDALRGEGIPPWFKVYTKLAHNPDFEALSDLQRGVLLTIWCEYAASDGLLTTTRLSKACHTRVRHSTLETLTTAGFIGLVASRPLAASKQRASLEERREEEKEKGEVVSLRKTEEPPAFATLDPALELEVARLVAAVTNKDNGSETVLRSFASRLPLGAIVKVRESSAGKPAAYAVSALKDECRERGIAAESRRKTT